MRANIKFHILITFSVVLFSCIEPFNIDSESFESVLVVEATITNELKHQEIKLSRTFSIDEDGLNPELNAKVSVMDRDSNVFEFSEVEPGIYISNQVFAAEQNKEYSLRIQTSNGRRYSSKPASFDSLSLISNINFQATDFNDVEGVGIFLSGTSDSEEARFYRYTYEETYKIVAPFWTPLKLVITDFDNFGLSLQPRTEEQKVCFRTETSNSIILTSTNDLSVNQVSNFRVRFIEKNEPILRNRYSIKINQFSQSREAYKFYETLQEFSNLESLFSQTQPGFFSGNLFSEEDANEKVVGFFDVSSVTSQRLFFNFNDVFEDERLPPYFVSCTVIEPLVRPFENAPPESSELLQAVNSGFFIFGYQVLEPEAGQGPYGLVSRACGDCTALGTNVEPDFWVE